MNPESKKGTIYAKIAAAIMAAIIAILSYVVIPMIDGDASTAVDLAKGIVEVTEDINTVKAGLSELEEGRLAQELLKAND